MSVSVCIPFGGDDPWRDTLYRCIRNLWSQILPGAEVITGVSDAPFNRAAARNWAAKEAAGDMLIFADADVIVRKNAVLQLLDTGAWGYPFNVYYTMRREWTGPIVKLMQSGGDVEDLYDLTDFPDDVDVIHRHPGPVASDCESACVAVPADLYRASGGYDEQFQGWGGEDRAFAIVLERLAGKPTRVAANALHMWHDTGGDPFDQPEWKHNERRLREYQKGRLGMVRTGSDGKRRVR